MKKILTIVLDGFGYREEEKGNAIKLAGMRVYEDFWNNHPHTTLYASEERVGLLKGQLGGSEIGHMTIGAGRVIRSFVHQIADFFEAPEGAQNYKELLGKTDKTIHIMGLCSDKLIHSDVNHFIKMYELLVKNGFKKIYFHLITDGRDSKIDSAFEYISMVQDKINEYQIGSIATLCGRYFAMDRDNNYDRTKMYYDLVTAGRGTKILDIKNALLSSYSKNITDEFIRPILVNEEGLIKDGDILLWMNFRDDRAKQILSAFVHKNFNEFSVNQYNDLEVYSLVEIDEKIKTKYFIPDFIVDNPLGIYFSKLGLKQARIAESEKYPHVTYFFDGEYTGKVEGADTYHIPSAEVTTYDLKPEMSAVGVTRKIIECMEKDYDFIFANFANPDMVGHTGNLEATIKACMAIDVCLGRIIESAEENFYTIFLLADHGNADTMFNEDGSINTAHSLAKVPFIISDSKVKLKDDGDLSNVAPTILEYMNISIPEQMTSESLIKKD